jgi:hypothetical protein
MKTKFAGTTAAVLLAASLSTPASAAFITGSISFSGGLSALSDIVNDVTIFNIGTPTIANGGTGDFLGVAGVTTTSDIDTGSPSGVIYNIGGFSFTLSAINNIVALPVVCDAGLCSDSQTFQMIGSVSAAGFESSAFAGIFSANGTCLESNVTDVCDNGTKSASWSSSVVATGLPAETPVAPTLALFGIGLAGLGLTRRTKA